MLSKKGSLRLKASSKSLVSTTKFFLLKLGFTCSRPDASLFMYKHDTCILYLLVYIDDIILVGNNNEAIAKFIARLHQEFSIKDLEN